MKIEVKSPPHKNQKAVLYVEGKPISWNQLKALVLLAMFVEEYNEGNYPLREHLAVLLTYKKKEVFEKLKKEFEDVLP